MPGVVGAPFFSAKTPTTTPTIENTKAVTRTAHQGTSGYRGCGGFGIGAVPGGGVDDELILFSRQYLFYTVSTRMGAGESTPAPPPVTVVTTDPYPLEQGLSNLSLAPGTTVACVNCDISLDSRASTSSVVLTRDYGNISDVECQRYDADLARVRNKEMSFRDFFNNLQDGKYSRPVSRNEKGQAFCEQLLFSDDDAAKVTDLASFDANIASLKNVRIRQVTGGGSFSSGTKAKFKLSLPIKAKYVAQLQTFMPAGTPRLVGFPWRWQWSGGTTMTTPVFEEISISTMTMYHPSPLRIENVQHDAVLSLNDPSDPDAKTVILIPLKSSNNPEDDSIAFFSKLAKHLNGIQSPDSVTGLYAETNIPTGNDWNIKQIFWLDTPGADNIAKVTDAYYTWIGATTYSRYEILPREFLKIRYGWKPDEGKQVRYFMLQTPVSISSTDLSFLTRNLPPTPAEEAIHQIPDPSIQGNSKVLYKQATEPAASAGCGVVRERMTNPGQGEILGSLFTSGSDVLDGAGAAGDSCNPFATNAKKALAEPSPFTPIRMAALFFNFMIVVALAVGTWIALFFVVNKDYDYSFRDFSKDAGKVVGKLALQTSGRIKDASYSASQSFPGGPSLAGLLPGKAAAPGGAPGEMPDVAGLLGKQPGLAGMAGLLGKKPGLAGMAGLLGKKSA